MTIDDSLLTREQAARLLDVKPDTLAVWAATRRYNLPFIKIGRNVRYRRSDIERFKQERLVDMNVTDHAAR